MSRFDRITYSTAVTIAFGILAGCSHSGVVVYTALDEEFSRPVLDEFTKKNGMDVAAKYDVESTKTVGLTNEIIAESARPRCDVFWNNEILNTVRLEKLGLLEAYHSPAAEAFDPQWRSPNNTWSGFAARARILLVNKKLLAGKEPPRSIMDLADPKWRGQVGIAKPLFGTTATHAACLFASWGDQRAAEFFKQLKANGVQVLGGNKQVAQAVAAGQIAFGLTDTDDAIEEVETGMPVEIVYPDQQPDGIGTLFIPNTVGIIKGGPNPEAGRRFVDFLLSPVVEAQLAECASAQIPLNPQVHVKLRVETPKSIKPMQIDFQAASEKWDVAARFLRDEFANGE